MDNKQLTKLSKIRPKMLQQKMVKKQKINKK